MNVKAISKQRTSRKRALLIGNDAYKKSIPLTTSINNSNGLNEKLSSIGFAVTVGNDLTNDEIDEMIVTFVSKIEADDLVFFFFTGYGIQLDDQYFLLPINDNRITDRRLYRKRAVDAQYTLEMIMKQQPLASVFVLDCCLNNEEHSEDNAHGNLGCNNVQNMHGIPHSLIVCNHSLGKTAENAHGKNHRSVFSEHLIEHISEPNLSIDKIMTTVCHETTKIDKSQVSSQINALCDTEVYMNDQENPGKSF